MADDTNKTGDDAAKSNDLTLTRTEIAFLDAIIEAKREEERGSSESVTIPLSGIERSIALAVVKAGKQATKWVLAVTGQVILANPYVLGGPALLEGASREEYVDRIKSIVDPSLEDLIELREQIEKQRGSKGSS